MIAVVVSIIAGVLVTLGFIILAYKFMQRQRKNLYREKRDNVKDDNQRSARDFGKSD